MEKEIKRVFRIIVGVILIVLGVFGLFSPLLQGIILILIGLYLLNYKLVAKFVKGLINRVE